VHVSSDVGQFDGHFPEGRVKTKLLLQGKGIQLPNEFLADIPIGNIQNIEELDITGSQDNEVTLNINDVIAITDGGNTLLIEGNPGDSITSDDTLVVELKKYFNCSKIRFLFL